MTVARKNCLEWPAERRIVVCSDLHLVGDDDWRAREFLRLLPRLRSAGDTLLIVLGDLFQFWLGAFDVRRKAYGTVLAALTEARAGGVSILFLHGNRDFLAGPEFPVPSLTDALTVQHGPRRIHFSHGDRFAVRDTRYQFMRRLIRAPWSRALFAALPGPAKARLARSTRRMSQFEVSRKGQRGKPLDVHGPVIARLIDQGYDLVVSGHYHRQSIRRVAGRRGEGLLAVMGSWEEQPSILEIGTNLIFHDRIDAL